jgi:hypothetical protein
MDLLVDVLARHAFILADVCQGRTAKPAPHLPKAPLRNDLKKLIVRTVQQAPDVLLIVVCPHTVAFVH